MTVQKNESITNQSVTGIVTSTPGTYAITFDVTGTATESGKNRSIRDRVSVAVK
jgi:hypothetical protein